MAEQCEILLQRLGDDTLREVAVLKLEGYRNQEMAGRMGCSLRSIERKLELIRKVWQHEGVS
jgi:DNA-directed RNA polymerase specialized sigma24 family protein